MKKVNNKKGFTIVELVIVIAVIAILAAVLIPTFSGVVEKANKTAALEKAKNALTAVLTENNGSIGNAHFAVVDGDKTYWFDYADGQLESAKDAYAVSSTPKSSVVYISKQDATFDSNNKYITECTTVGKVGFNFIAGSATENTITAAKVETAETGGRSLSLSCIGDIASGVVAIVLPKA